MSEQKWLTITVPYEEHASTFSVDGRGDVRQHESKDRRAWIWVRRDRREVRVLTSDIHEAVARAWPGEPTTDRAKRLAEIEAVIGAVHGGVWSWEAERDGGWTLYSNRGEPLDPDMPRGICNIQHGANMLRVDRDGFDSTGEALRAFVLAARKALPAALDEIREADAALVALGIADDGRPLAERIRALAPVAPPEIAARHLAIGEDARAMDLGAGWQAHEDRGVLLALRRAPVPAPQTLVDCDPLTPSERAGLVERASPATRTFLAAVKAGASVADLETVLRAYAAEDRERKAWAAVAPPPEPDIEPAIGE